MDVFLKAGNTNVCHTYQFRVTYIGWQVVDRGVLGRRTKGGGVDRSRIIGGGVERETQYRPGVVEGEPRGRVIPYQL